jgi:low affinity Fe/Cu permease
MAHPAAFAIAAAYGSAWFLFSRETFNWNAVIALVTLLIALFIQRSSHRDTQAIHAKLDELLRSHPEAMTELAKLDDEEPEDIEEFRRSERDKDLRSEDRPRN